MDISIVFGLQLYTVFYAALLTPRGIPKSA